MRFKIDENLPVEVADLLRANMHDAMTIFDQHMVGELDPKVASVCKSEERAIITLDLDFSDIRTIPRANIQESSSFDLVPSQSPMYLRFSTSSFRCSMAVKNYRGTYGSFRENGIRIREGAS